ncbi:hypothetical protein GINT2_000987 [Glugoides intestinalis]
METMVSNSNNIEQEIYLWQDLVWSIQPEGLFSTKSLIVISIVIFLIMTWLKEKKKEKEEKHYYNNLLNGFLTILLTIIFGKGLEILFRILHIICSGAYGNVVFSLNDIFISLLFGCIFVISGSLLLFNKKLRELLRLQKSEYTILKEIMADDKAPIEDRIKALMEYLKLTMVGKPEETGTKLKNVCSEFEKTMDSLNEIADSLVEMKAKLGPDVKDKLKKEEKTTQELFSKLSEKLLNYELNEAGPEEIETELDEIVAGLDEIVAVFKECKEILTEEKAAILAAYGAARRL